MYKISLITVDSEKIENLNKGDRKYLVDVAQRTWQFFRDYLTTENKDSYNEKDIYSNGFCALHDDACRG